MDKKESKRYIRIFDEQNYLYEEYARKNGLVSKSLYILMWLYYNPQGITQKKIVEKTYSSKQVVHATIKNWRTKGYISECEQATDRRNKLLTLTTAGQKYASTILDPLEQMEIKALSTLSPDEQQQLIQLTRKYTKKLKDKITGDEQHND